MVLGHLWWGFSLLCFLTYLLVENCGSHHIATLTYNILWPMKADSNHRGSVGVEKSISTSITAHKTLQYAQWSPRMLRYRNYKGQEDCCHTELHLQWGIKYPSFLIWLPRDTVGGTASLSTSTSISPLVNVEISFYTSFQSELCPALLIPHGWVGAAWWAPSCPLVPLPLFYRGTSPLGTPLQSRKELHRLNTTLPTLKQYWLQQRVCVLISCVFRSGWGVTCLSTSHRS